MRVSANRSLIAVLLEVFRDAVSQLAEFAIQEMPTPKEWQYRIPAFFHLAAGAF